MHLSPVLSELWKRSPLVDSVTNPGKLWLHVKLIHKSREALAACESQDDFNNSFVYLNALDQLHTLTGFQTFFA